MYYLTLNETILKTDDKEVEEKYPGDKNEEGFKFIAFNFYPEKSNPNNSETFKKIINMNEPLSLVGNILWLLDDYCKNNPNKRCFLFAADKKRMKLYSNAFEKLKDNFFIFPQKKYSDDYIDEQALLIKK